MKTEDLVVMLGTNVESADHRQVPRTVSAAVAAGAIFALITMFIALGIRTNLTDATALVYLPLKLIFTFAVVILTSIALVRLARPGGERTTPIALVALPFVAIVLLGCVSLASAPPSHWDKMIVGDQWLECLLSIPIIAIVPFAIVIWAVRRMAPTDLVRAGALAGLLAGGLSAAAYALHCTDDSLSFVALWYGGTIVICTIAGAMLGPRFLRW